MPKHVLKRLCPSVGRLDMQLFTIPFGARVGLYSQLKSQLPLIQGAEDDVLRRIGAVEALARVASCPNDTASKLAARALKTLGEDVPHRLPQQVQLWRSSDVNYWVKNVIDFPDHAKAFSDCKVDGDLLLQMNDAQLREDVGMTNGLHRSRFLRHLDKLKTTSDYSSCDHSKIDDWLMRIGAHMTRYT